MNKLEQLKEKVGIQISEDLLYRILFEMNRYFDKDLTLEIQKTQKQLGRVFNQKERNLLRKYYYYGMPLCLEQLGIEKFNLISFTFSLNISMNIGSVPQQPPSIVAPASIVSTISSEKSFAVIS